MKTTTIIAISFIVLMLAFLGTFGFALATKNLPLGFGSFVCALVGTTLLIAINTEVE